MKLLTYLWKNLDEYDVPAMPGARVVVKDEEAKTTEHDVHAGVAWETSYTDNGLEASRVAKAGAGERDTKIDGWDTAWLRESFLKDGGTGAYDEVIANVIKWEWASRNDAGEYPSNNDIVKAHTTSTGKVQEGYSLRNVKKYTWAFNKALESRQQEQKAK